MTNRTEYLTLLMAYAVDKTFKIGPLEKAKFTFNYMGDVVAFQLPFAVKTDARLLSLEHGEGYDWHAEPEHIFLPLKISIEEDHITWRLANGMPGSVDTEGGENQEEFDEIYDVVQRNFSYLREQAIREQPVVVFAHGLPDNAYTQASDFFFEEPFREEDYEE